ncbi:HNH endonuclease signature motif containing protein [Amycolatopsis sp. WAC 01416]|uniref:HNH endonuclease signature motif containing protein n=1 Tax=Amycolatopsis sp. WAC 01416 TaxID=2203196 RepID=UPI0018F28A63|nr:HNH endonuclease signature motif containing protein [Amycolatopsis sp. WAC 01416]
MALLKEITESDVLGEVIGSLDSLGDRDVVDVAVAASVGIARLEAVRFRAIARLGRHRGGVASVVQEVAFALSVVDRHAGTLVSTAEALTTRLPRTLGLMDRGVVDGFGAAKVAAATSWLSDEDARAADVLLEDRLEGKNSEQVRKAASHAAMTVDREGASRRAEHSRAGRRLTVRHGEAGVASIEVEDGPVEKVAAAYTRIDREARALKTGDEPRTLDQLRADVALDLLLSGQGGKSERAEVFLYMDLNTYLGVNEDPAELAGHGHIPASLAREIASGPDTVLRRIITDPLSGQVLDLGRDRYRPTAGMGEFVRVRDRECRRPGCHRPAQACDLDHVVPWQFGGHTNADELIDLCRRDHRLKDEPGWIYRLAADGTLTVTTPTGQHYDSSPPPLHEPRPATEPPPF